MKNNLPPNSNHLDQNEMNSDDVYVFPASFAQQRLWILDQIEPNNIAYNMPSAYRIRGQLDNNILEESIQAVVNRHESLRTTFSVEDGLPVQIVKATEKVSHQLIDLRADADPEETALSIILDEIQTPFDLESGPLLRTHLFRLHSEDHIFLLNMHHIISDGWSMGVFWRELGLFFDEITKKSINYPAPLPIQYADFTLWQLDQISDQGQNDYAPEKYWLKEIDNIPFAEITADYPRPSNYSYSGKYEILELGPTLTSQLQRFSQQENVTLFMTLFAVYQILFSRLTGQKDFGIGTFTANRTREELEGLIGFFVNTLVIRANLLGRPSFREVLKRVRDKVLSAFEYQEYSFEKLVGNLQPTRDPSRTPFFQTTFLLQNTPAVELHLSDLEVSNFSLVNESSKFDLSFVVYQNQSQLVVYLNYNPRLFKAQTIKRIADNYYQLLSNLVNDPAQSVWSVPILNLNLWQKMLIEWNADQSQFPESTCIPDLFEKWVEQTPHQICVVLNNEQITYAELNQQANYLAKELIGYGVCADIPVLICLERSIELIIGILAVLKAGGAYVVLDHTFPPERLEYLANDSGARLLIASDRFLDLFSNVDLPIIDFDWQTNLANSQKISNPYRSIDADNLAYIMYTSGSTGNPKGVMISHRNVIGFLYGYKDVTLDGPHRIGTTVAPFNFDTSVEEIFATLCFGGTLHILLPEHSTDVKYFAEYLLKNKITTAYIVPDFLVGVAENLKRHKSELKLKTLITGLAPKTEKTLQSFRDLSPNLRILNAYGPTEVTYGATAYEFVEMTNPDLDVPIGLPFPNYETYIVDKNIQPVPVGVVGELLIGGVGISRGYLNQSDLTAEKFIPDPFSQKPGGRLYRSGDLARYQEDGNIEFLGRSDFQVKIRGYRIELGEIEAALGANLSVHKSVVMIREDTPHDKRIIAYVMFKSGQSATITELRECLRKTLPSYMMPNYFVFVDEFPLMLNGKIDRRSLLNTNHHPEKPESKYSSPRDDLDRQMVHIWEKVLKVKPIGIDDDFFELGGHSIMAVRIFSIIEKQIGKKIPLATLFEAPQIQSLTNLIRKENWEPNWTSLVPIRVGGSHPPLFCIAPIGGNVLTYRDLVVHLSPEQPCYALRSQGWYDEAPPFSNLKDMAAHYIGEIRNFQPEGPYYLCGSSFGGMVAFEMAQQMRSEGLEIGLIALFDTSGPGYPRHLPEITRLQRMKNRQKQRFASHWRNLNSPGWEHKLKYLQERGRAFFKRIYWSIRITVEKTLIQKRRNIRQVVEANLKAVHSYEPQDYEGKITLFRASNQPPDIYSDATLGWGKLVSGPLEIHEIEGYHGSLVSDPQAKNLAAVLSKCLEQAYQNLEIKNGENSDVFKR